MKINKMFFDGVLVIIPILLFGCTKAAWYNGVKQGAENECHMLPQSAIESCLERLNKSSYDDYERARQETKK